jgi:hypothetical protein
LKRCQNNGRKKIVFISRSRSGGGTEDTAIVENRLPRDKKKKIPSDPPPPLLTPACKGLWVNLGNLSRFRATELSGNKSVNDSAIYILHIVVLRSIAAPSETNGGTTRLQWKSIWIIYNKQRKIMTTSHCRQRRQWWQSLFTYYTSIHSINGRKYV